MINLYYGRSEIDRMQFMYEKIAEYKFERIKNAVVIVPDQYTLEAEKKAFSVLNTRGIMDVEIISFSRLALRMTGEKNENKFLDDMGRNMLLRKVVSRNKDKLGVFARIAEQTEFISMMGSMIQEFKQYKVSPEIIKGITEQNREKYSDKMLMKKLSDVSIIYDGYENELKSGYCDTEDQLNMLCEEIKRKNEFKDTVVWIEGFEFFSKRLLSVIKEIALNADSLNISLVYSEPGCNDYNIFAPIEATIREINTISENIGMKAMRFAISTEFKKKQKAEISHLHRNLYAFPYESIGKKTEAVSLWECENREAEVERVAEEIRKLVDNHNYRFKDIAIVANDIPERESLIKRIFPKHGIEFFDNSKISGIYNKYMQFILAFCREERIYYSNESIFRMIDTDIIDISIEEREILENYVLKYGIEGSLWKKDFYKLDRGRKTDEEAEAEILKLNQIRKKLMNVLENLYERLKKCGNGRDFAENFFLFLKDEIKLDEKIQKDGDRLKQENKSDYGSITLQLWNKTVNLLEQVAEVMGESKCSRGEFFEILKTGIETMKISRIPVALDQVLIGDFSTAKLNNIKILMILGANDGLIPIHMRKSGILSDIEKQKLNDIAGEICVSNGSSLEKEKLNIYQTFSLPSDKLYLSYLCNENDGGEMSPSQLVIRVEKILTGLKKEKIICNDITHRGEIEYKSRINYIAEFGDKEQGLIYTKAGAEFRNLPERISEKHFKALYGEEPGMSPTSMEAYGRCPFSHFLKYGICVDERKVFEITPPEMGTVFHEVIMKFSQEISRKNQWNIVNQELCKKMMDELAEKAAVDHRNGQMFEGALGKYRIARIKSVCEKNAEMLSNHINRGSFDKFYFEIPFGRGRVLPPIEVGTKDGKKVYIEGRIDRIDIAPSNNGTLIKVIDYKSGNDKVVKKEILTGYKLQLMLYMIAANEGIKQRESSAEPAGVFYFKIQEPLANGNESDISDSMKFSEFVGKNFRKAFKMDGIVVNEPEIIDAFDENFTGFSEIIRVRKLKNGNVKGTGDFAALSRKEFGDLMENTMKNSEKICEKFLDGSVNISPIKIDEDTKACTWCKYKSICNFDTEIPGFKFKL